MEPSSQPSVTRDLTKPASGEEIARGDTESDEQVTFKEPLQLPAVAQNQVTKSSDQSITSSSTKTQPENQHVPVEVSDTTNSDFKGPDEVNASNKVLRDSSAGGDYYNPPSWALPCPEKDQYFIEVIKNGTSLPDDTVVLSGADHCVFGRQPRGSLNPESKTGKCSVMLHPSISRVHALLQYGTGPDDQPPGWFIYDLQSTHGTFVNKHRALPRRYIRLHVGYVLRFGSSTRLLVLHGPDHDVEPETKESWSELVAAHAKRKAEQEAKLRNLEDEEREGKRQRRIGDETTSAGGECDWGIAGGFFCLEDANDEDGSENLLQRLADEGSCLHHEKLYIEDPKKALKSYFDREGIDPPPEYDFVEGRFGQQMCRLELPLDSGTVYAEVPVTGRKRKEAIVACALEACHMLDRLGEFDANKEGAEALRRAREKEYWQANDCYSSDEDNFLDRTGQVEARRRRRMRKLGVEVTDTEEDRAAETPSEEAQDSLTMLSNLEKIGKAIIEVEEELHAAERAMEATGENASEMDELEAYMDAIKKGAPNRAARQALKRRLFALRQDETRLLCKLGIRRGTGRFCSSSSSAAANAIRSALANKDNSIDGTYVT
ncbi:unnamed protein product [Mesocestoides corti]|uniref:FHA domain-containing protein n=1 Tax=Mesocestoides corti TaxID=53468 RepID=A0A0R3UG05_MESCO|nr:unnamed protein product [Mesocestoides corti]